MKLTLLGTGNPVPTLKLAGSSYLLRTGADVILFDHGPGANWRLMQAGLTSTEVTHVLFSHLHYDHCVDFVRLFLNRWDMGAGKVARMQLLRSARHEGVRRADVRGRGRVLAGPEGAHREPNQHRRLPLAWRRCPALLAGPRGRGDCPGRRGRGRWLAPDPGRSASRAARARLLRLSPGGPGRGCSPTRATKAMHEIAHEADALVHMCSNISQKPLNPGHAALNMGHLELGALGRDARVNTLVVSHINPGPDRPGVREHLIAEMGEIYSGTLIWVEDLMEFEIGDGKAGEQLPITEKERR